jgi:hypothetical protein
LYPSSPATSFHARSICVEATLVAIKPPGAGGGGTPALVVKLHVGPAFERFAIVLPTIFQ